MRRRSQSRSGFSGLTREDRALWNRVADTTTPISHERATILKDEMSRLMAESAPRHRKSPEQPILPDSPMLQPAVPVPYNARPVAHPIEERIVKKLASGRQKIDARIDLHGMTQDRARFALLDFLQMAQMSDSRIVLVITGKGNEGTGVLRRNVPMWLAGPPFSGIVNGYRESHVSHGGEGALYVRVRRRRPNGAAR